MKYNKSEIMKNAWTIRRNENVNMSSALKKAWAQAKCREENKMKGTERQVALAEKIRDNVVTTFENMFPVIPAIAPNQAAAETAVKELQSRIDRLNSEGVYAGDIIDLFKDIRFNGDLQHDFNEVMAVYNVTVPYTTTARALLGR